MDISDPFDLARFRTAQDAVFETALAELRAGAKRTHWMWFIFPQLRGLGRSSMAQLYGIASIEEARAYLADAVLGDRLRLATMATLNARTNSAHAIFGSPDDMKFRSSMTLFAIAEGESSRSIYQQALDRYFAGQPDALTVRLVDEIRMRTRI